MELHCVEFGSASTDTTPVMVRKSTAVQFQPMTPRIRKEMMDNQIANNKLLTEQEKPTKPIKEPPVDCCGVMYSRVAAGQPAWAITVWVEESYEEIKFKMGLTNDRQDT